MLRRVSIFSVPWPYDCRSDKPDPRDQRVYAQIQGSIKAAKAVLRQDHAVWRRGPISLILTYKTDKPTPTTFWIGSEEQPSLAHDPHEGC